MWSSTLVGTNILIGTTYSDEPQLHGISYTHGQWKFVLEQPFDAPYFASWIKYGSNIVLL